MAIYRLSADIVRRSEGRTVTAAAAYRAGELIEDRRTGLAFDYRRRHGVLDAAILAPAGAPGWMRDRVRLWNGVEAAERRKDAQLARDIELALPHELPHDEQRDLVHQFARIAFVDQGMVADVALHAPSAAGDEKLSRAYFADPAPHRGRRLRRQATPLERHSAARALAGAVGRAGQRGARDRRRRCAVDHRSLEAQGIERLPQIHLGLAVTEMRRREIATERAGSPTSSTM